MGNITAWYWYLKYMTSIYVVVMMLRFFKSFRPNPRTNIVVRESARACSYFSNSQVQLQQL